MATASPKKPTTPRKPATKSGTGTTRKTTARGKDGTFKKSDNGHWGTAAIVGGVAAVGAVATAALFALRGSSVLETIEDTLLGGGETAHQVDGEDASDSFDARIADEGIIPA